MQTARPQEEVRADCERLAEIFCVLQRRFLLDLSKELSRGNVSFPQYFLLGFLSQQPFLTMSEIAGKMGHTTAAATGLVDRLEILGLVRRTHATDDRRKIEVQSTPQGTALVRQIRNDMVNNLSTLMTTLEVDEQLAWIEIYEKIFAFVQTQQNK
ncbi:MAG: hypothetical protein QOD99_2099 [Chthoniobacter sp.]|jgi:DNA-binding MarR family transcriptional regulator|nr:hypothetical protein [Chthoniobacter sp.]